MPPHGCRDDLLGVCVLHSHFLIWLDKQFDCQFEEILPGNADKIIKFHIISMSFPVHQELPSPRSMLLVCSTMKLCSETASDATLKCIMKRGGKGRRKVERLMTKLNRKMELKEQRSQNRCFIYHS